MALDLPTGASFLERNAHVLTAIASILLALVLVYVTDRAFRRRAIRLAQAVGRGELSPVADTRLRFLRRLVTFGILMIGAAIAVSQFTGLSRLAASVLASSALAAAVIGFAARQTLANLVAGVMLAITQPLRIGDLVTIEDETGTVEDVRLNYTIVRGADNTRIFIPNERLASGVLHNASIVDPHVTVEVTVWLPPTADANAALTALGDGAAVTEVTAWGVELSVAGGSVAPAERAARAAELRAQSLRTLRSAGLLAS